MCECVLASTCVLMCICVCVCMYVCMYECMSVCLCMCVCACVCSDYIVSSYFSLHYQTITLNVTRPVIINHVSANYTELYFC